MVFLQPTKGGRQHGGLTLQITDQRVIEKLTDDVSIEGTQLAQAKESPHRLLYTTPVLTRDLHLSGTARVTVTLTSSAPAANLSVWLVALPWTEKGRIYDNIITRGWADPQNTTPEASAPLKPNKAVTVSFDLQPDDQVIPAGKQVGLMIFSSDRDYTLWPKAGTQLSVVLDDTALELPVVGGRSAYEAALEK
jgi:X-Pro dipeptidyl-peptidase